MTRAPTTVAMLLDAYRGVAVDEVQRLRQLTYRIRQDVNASRRRTLRTPASTASKAAVVWSSSTC